MTLVRHMAASARRRESLSTSEFKLSGSRIQRIGKD